MRGALGPILLVADGASIHTRRLASALVDRGLTVTVAGFEGDLIPGAAFVRLGVQPVGTDRRYLQAVPRLAQLIRRRRPAIIHGHYVSSYGLMAALARSLSRSHAPLVQTAWGTDLLVTARTSRLRRVLAAIALRPAALSTGDSADLLDEVERLAPGSRRQRFVFGPPSDLLTGPAGTQPVMLSTRRLDPDMRVDLVVRAFRAARAAYPELEAWRLVVAGDGRDAGIVRAAAEGDSAVELVGQLDPRALRRHLSAARVVVSAPVSDATSAALLEALAAGLCPVVNDLPANREWVTVALGEIVPRDPTEVELADAMARATRRSHPELSRAAVAAVTWEAEVSGLIDRYEELCR